MRRLAHRIVYARMFEYFLAFLIIGTSILQGVSTSDILFEQYQDLIVWFVILMLLVLLMEVILKMLAAAPRIDRYFRDPWNVFDFLVITTVIVGIAVYTAAIDFALLVVVVRLLRLLQGFTTIKAMRIILTTMFRSIPDMAHILILLCIIIYLYALSGHNLLREHDPEHWGTLGKSVLSLFQVVTLDGWSEIMQTAPQGSAVRLDLFCELCHCHHIHRGQPVHRRCGEHHGRSQARASAHVKSTLIQR